MSPAQVVSRGGGATEETHLQRACGQFNDHILPYCPPHPPSRSISPVPLTSLELEALAAQARGQAEIQESSASECFNRRGAGSSVGRGGASIAPAARAATCNLTTGAATDWFVSATWHRSTTPGSLTRAADATTCDPAA